MNGSLTQNNISYRLYEEEDYHKYVNLYKRVFNKEISLNYFQWKFNNVHNPAVIFCAFNSENEMVGSRVVLLTDLCRDEQMIKGAQSVDSMVDGTYRGMGIYKKLNQMAIEHLKEMGVKKIMTFPNQNSFPPLNKLGWEEIYSISNRMKILNYKHLFPSIPVLKQLLTVKDNMYRNNRLPPNMTISEVRQFDNRIVDFIETSLKTRIHQRRSKEFLEWKYSEKPESEYEKLVVEVDHAITGFFIIRKNKHGQRIVATILECVMTEEVNQKKIMRVLLAYLRSKNFDIVKIWSYEKTEVNFSFLSLGFLKRKTAIKFAVNQLNDDQNEFGDWYISAGDADTA